MREGLKGDFGGDDLAVGEEYDGAGYGGSRRRIGDADSSFRSAIAAADCYASVGEVDAAVGNYL